jgi:hypothetical protein
MRYEKPQKENPNQLTIKQHCFPAKSIARFADVGGCVEVKLIKQNKKLKLKPEDQLFCAKRTWDQRAESGFMKKIEDRFQEIVESILKGIVTTISLEEQSAITDMFAIWNVRWHRNQSPIADQKLDGIIDTAIHYTKDNQEKLEKNDITAITPDFLIPGRALSGVNIQRNLFIAQQQMVDAHWGILHASKGEFVVPDNCSNARILPLTPEFCLFSQSLDETIDEKELKEINKILIGGSKNYYFGRNISKCLV